MIFAQNRFAFLDHFRERVGIVGENVPNLFFAQRVQIGVAQRFDVVRATIAVLRARNVQNGDFAEHGAFFQHDERRPPVVTEHDQLVTLDDGHLLAHVALPTNIIVRPVKDRFQLLQRFEMDFHRQIL